MDSYQPKKAAWLAAVAASLLLLGSCGGGGGGGGDVTPPPTPAEVAAALNDALVLPPGAFTLATPTAEETDSSVTVTSNAVPNGSLSPGSQASLSINFTADGSSNVTGAAIGFGTANSPPSKLMAIPVNTNGATSGAIDFSFAVDASMCANLSTICHNIRCYEYAVVDGQRVTAANVNDIAFACGGCDEPSCQELLTNCPTGGVDITGNWDISTTVTQVNGPCQDELGETSQYVATISQVGNDVTVSGEGVTLSGTLFAGNLSLMGSYPEDGGMTTVTSTSIEVTETALSGEATWSWTDGQSNCNGTTNWTGTRVGGGNPPSGGGGTNSTPLAILAYATGITASDLHIIDPTGFDHYVGGPTGTGAELSPSSGSVANSESWYLYLTGTYQVYIANQTSGNMIYAVSATSLSTAGALLEESGNEPGAQTPTWSFTVN
ncbi:MAG: hypothetical protein ACI89X_001118 [Planctomycetota bacterium]|jgi:hypothetical protein